MKILRKDRTENGKKTVTLPLPPHFYRSQRQQSTDTSWIGLEASAKRYGLLGEHQVNIKFSLSIMKHSLMELSPS
jgi:hypothetical protein